MTSNPPEWPHVGVDDEESFTRFAQEVGSQALRIVFSWTRNLQLSEDLVQEAFLRAWRSRVAITGNARAWFYRILWNTFIDYQRHARRRHEVDLESNISFVECCEPYANIEDQIDIALSLTKLSDLDRYLIALRYGGDFTCKDISTITGIPTSTVRVKIHRALKQIRRNLLSTKAKSERSQMNNSSERRRFHEEVHGEF
ncbi:RNA polymerase sigma factor [Alicyclobacillus cellulosilyticus]|uniref:RNA polymerase sigma factor n=1 Tax=Alicyclobacillus cellulosilyticus TaxID=1003997 RepID=UPI001663EC29